MRAKNYKFGNISRGEQEKQYYFDNCQELEHRFNDIWSKEGKFLILVCNRCGVLARAKPILIKVN